ncbi:hypothetical protein [Enterococcus phage MDA2]|uniref:Uncharacterized protein n=1 Tax=Enterococcus phage MDA2 TaxID=2816459 RepID=A0AAE7RHL2_9CAUD|nr:hypothetical protein [Enterococcus phage MDA2]
MTACRCVSQKILLLPQLIALFRMLCRNLSLVRLS